MRCEEASRESETRGRGGKGEGRGDGRRKRRKGRRANLSFETKKAKLVLAQEEEGRLTRSL